MRIVEVSHGLGLGGAEVALVNRLRWAPAVVSTLVVNTKPRLGDMSREIAEQGATVEDAPLLRLIGPSRLLSRIRAFQPDVVLVHSPSTAIFLLAASAMRRVPAPVVVVAHSEGLKRRYRSLLFLLNRQAILHVAVSKRVAESVQCRGAHRVCVSYLGASTTQQEDVATPERQGLTFLFLGRLAPSKRVDLLLDVLRTIATDFRSAGARLLIVGTGSELPSLKSFVRRHRLDDIVSFKGTVRPVDEVLAVSDVFILCSDYEGMPVSIFEALLAGLQIIATDVGGISEVVHSEEGHHLVRPRDSSAIRGAMLQALHAGQQPARRLERKAAAAHLHALNAATSFYDLLAEALLHEHGATLRTWQKVSSDEQ